MKISFDESKNIIPSGRKHYTCNYCIDHFKTKFVLIHHIHPSCNHCIQYLKRKFVLMHHTMFQHAENSILANTAFVTYKLNSFWFIREGPNMWKTVFLQQSLHTILQKKICFDASQNVPTWRKQYSCNHCIQNLKRKFVLMHHTMFQHAENIILAITAFVTSKLNSFWFIREGPSMWKTVFLQSMHTILQKKIRFDLSHNVPSGRKQ